MLSLPRYLLGMAEVGLLAGFVTLGASAVRARLLPRFAGAPAHLATAVVAVAMLIWTAELLGTVGIFKPLPYLTAVGLTGVAAWALHRRVARGEGAHGRVSPLAPPAAATGPAGPEKGNPIAVLVGLAIGLLALIAFAGGAADSLRTGMTGFDTTWYHGTFAAGFFQGGDTWDLHFIAPQFLAWFYPANAEIFHAVGMLAFGRDVLSPLINLGWFAGCLLALWCIGRRYRVELFTLVLGAVALSLPAFADQAGEARNDIAGTFFLLAAIAIALHAQASGERRGDDPVCGSTRIPAESVNALAVAGLAAGLAAGTKLNFLLPAAVLVFGLALVAPPGGRRSALAATCLAALVGGGYWYLRNLVHTGNPLPWFDGIGPISLPAPVQPLGGREGHSVLAYLADGSVWSDWLLPGLRDGMTVLWPLLLALALGALILCLGRRAAPALRVAAVAGLAVALAWIVAPTSASGPDGMPRGFESGLRYLVPALVLGLGLVPIALPDRLRRAGAGRVPNGWRIELPRSLAQRMSGRETSRARSSALTLTAVVASAGLVAIGYPVQRHYLANRYANPEFAAPGLNAAFRWASLVSHARIATTTTRQYPLFGTDLSNDVRFLGVEQPHGGFTAPAGCREWRRLLNAGHYDYVVASRDRVESGEPPYPASAVWTAGPGAKVVLRKPPTVIFRLTGSLAPSACP